MATDVNDLAADTRISVVPYSGISDTKTQTRILNSSGLDVNFEQQHFSAYSYPLAKEGEVSKMSGYGLVLRNFTELDADETPIGAAHITVSDDPTYLSGSAYHPFDAVGEMAGKTVLIEKGILKNYLTNLEYAQKMRLPHTASAARSPTSEMNIACSNLIFEKGNKSRSELLKIHDQVIYVTELSGFHSGFNSSTGDFSLPGQGFSYVNGQMLHPVDQFVVSGNILTVLQTIEELGNEYNPQGSAVIIPDLLVSELFFAGEA